MSGELLVSFSITDPTRIIRKRTAFKITPRKIRAWFELHCPHIDEPTDAMINRAIYVFKTLLHRADGRSYDGTYIIYREFHMCSKYPLLKKKETFKCLFFRNHLWVCNNNPNDINMVSKLVDIILNDSDYKLFMSYWPTKPTYVDILTTIMLISRRLLSGSQHWYEFPREIVEKIVCL